MREISEEKNSFYYKPKISFLPDNLNLDEWLQDQKLYGFNNFSKDDCAQLISSLYTVPVYNKSLREEAEKGGRPFYSLSSKIMYSYTKEYPKYIDLLLKSGIWESDNTYEVGKKSIGYRFTGEYLDVPCKKYLNYKFGKQTSKNESVSATIKECETYSPTINKLIDCLKSINLDYKPSFSQLNKELKDGIININKYNCTACALEKINNGEYFAKQDEYGRLHTNITNLKKEYRNYITVTGQKRLISFDLKNSQPFFSTILTKTDFWESRGKNCKLNINDLKPTITNSIHNKSSIIMFTKSVEHNEDVVKYVDLVINGGLYEFFLQRLLSAGIKCDSRKKAKKKIFKIFFSKAVHLKNNKSAMVFKDCFPSIYRLFELIKRTKHNMLAVLLQGIESQILIEGVAGGFINKFPDTPIFTIHDSILVPIKKAITLKWDMIKYIKQKTDYKPSLEIEILKPPME